MTIDLRWPSSKKETLDPIDFVPSDSPAARLWMAKELRKRRDEEAFAVADALMGVVQKTPE